MEQENYLVITHKEFLNSSGQMLETCEVAVFPNLKMAIVEVKSIRTSLEQTLPKLFGSHDYETYIDLLDGKEVIDLSHDILFTDKSGRQAAAIYIRTEQSVCETIREKVDASPNKVLHLEDTIFTSMYDDDTPDDETVYKPLNVLMREYTDDETGNVEYIYDVEMLSRYPDGNELFYVESLDCIGFRTLANIYISIQNS